jgi:hypothetical protein
MARRLRTRFDWSRCLRQAAIDQRRQKRCAERACAALRVHAPGEKLRWPLRLPCRWRPPPPSLGAKRDQARTVTRLPSRFVGESVASHRCCAARTHVFRFFRLVRCCCYVGKLGRARARHPPRARTPARSNAPAARKLPPLQSMYECFARQHGISL